MTLAEKIKSVEEVYQSLNVEIASFQESTGLHCKAGCGKCCYKPDIAATVLEFLPLAYKLYKGGQAYDWHERLQGVDTDICKSFKMGLNGAGTCIEYAYRGLICRLFGFSARRNKHAQLELVSCQVIKSEMAGPFQQAVVLVGVGQQSAPLMSNYYMKLLAIDEDLGRTFYPINVAIRKAIEVVLHYYAYREEEGEVRE